MVEIIQLIVSWLLLIGMLVPAAAIAYFVLPFLERKGWL